MILKKKPLAEILFLVFISAVVYLPRIGSLTYFKDEWYFIYDATIAGADVFRAMFSIDRPARGVFFEMYYLLFGPHAFPYHIAGFLWRVVAAVSALWVFGILWPRARRFAFFAALLFVLYPGYSWWISAIEYQPHMASLALEVISIGLTLKAVQVSSRASKIVYMVGAVLSGWAYLALVEYAIGMEGFRFLSVYVLVGRDERLSTIRLKFLAALRAWAWNFIIPLGFIFWRIFIFNNERKATDIGVQLSGLFSAPLQTAFGWFIQFFNSLVNLGALAWVAQFSRFFFGMWSRDMLIALMVAGLVLLMVILAEKLMGSDEIPREKVSHENAGTLSGEALLLGLSGMIMGILPVVMANRFIDLDGFSYYALPASLAAALSLTGLIYAFVSPSVQRAALYLSIAFASLAHYGISINALDEEHAIERFWWQVSWRVPALRPGTTLVIHYPSGNIGDDGFGVMEAANMIYFPQPSAQIPVHYQISAITLNAGNLQDVLLGKLYRQSEYRSHSVDFDYGNVLVLSQPSSSSCVHVLDGQQPLISVLDPADVRLAAPSSKIENVIADSKPFVPQSLAFGREPEHGWCYHYEKAELALQVKDWKQVVDLGEEAIRLGLHPEDQSEWLPFLQAYALTGNTQRVKQTAPKINMERSLRLQACDMLTALEAPVTPELQGLIATLYCRNAE